MNRPVSLILGLEPAIDLASIVLPFLGDRPTHPIWYRCRQTVTPVADTHEWGVDLVFEPAYDNADITI